MHAESHLVRFSSLITVLLEKWQHVLNILSWKILQSLNNVLFLENIT